jgi:Cu/Ag efflux protein CusF
MVVISLLGSGAACSRRSVPEKPVQRYQLRGEVVRVQPASQVVVIKHEKIDDWMEAMTMDFPVRNRAEFSKLREGMRIRATVVVQDFDFWLEDIRQD